MTEIQAGNNYSVSTRFMQEMHKAASDNSVDAKELARLVQVASEDASGLTDDEKSMLTGLFTKKLDTTGLTAEEQKLFDQIGGSVTSQEVVDQNIQELKNVTAHENDPNSLNFSKVKLVTESKSFLSKASFGLFGGTNIESHALNISDGNIPSIANPPQTTAMDQKHELDRNNLINMMGPLDQELTEGLKNDSDVRKRLAASMGAGVDPNSQAVTDKIKALQTKISDFKNDPKQGDWTTSSDLTALMNSYAQNPPTDNPRINSAYMGTLLGAFWNATDSSAIAKEQKNNTENGDIQVPAAVSEINQTLNSVNDLAKTDAQSAVDKASTLIAQLDDLKASNPDLYKQVIRGTDESAIDLLRGQVSDLKQYLKEGGVMGAAQMTQLNNIYANLHQMQKTLDVEPASAPTSEAIAAKQALLDNPDYPEAMKAPIREELAALQAQPTTAPENQAKLDAIRSAMVEAQSAVYEASVSSQDSAISRSDMVNDLQEAESTLSNLLSQHGISDAGRTQLQAQLDATRTALTQLQNNQEVKFEAPEQEANFNKVLQNLQKMKPEVPTAPAPTAEDVPAPVADGSSDLGVTPENPTGDIEVSPYSGAIASDFMLRDYTLGSTNGLSNSPSSLMLGTGLDLNLGISPVIKSPDPYGFSSSSSSLLNPEPLSSSLGFCGVGGSSLYNDPFSLYSPSLSFSGLSGGLGGYNPGSLSLSFPSYSSFLTSPSPIPATPSQPASASPGATGTAPAATTPRPSMSNVFLEGVGEDPANVKPLSPEQEQRKSKALETIAQIEAPGSDASPEAKQAAAILKQLVQNPTGSIQTPNGKITPPEGSFESSLTVLETYQDLKNKGIDTADAEVVFMLAAQGVKSGESPANIAASVQKVAKSGSTEDIKANLKGIRTEKFVANQQDITKLAGNLKNSELVNDLATGVLGDDFVKQVQALEGGANVSNVEEALAFIKSSGKDTTPSYVTQIIQSKNFAEQYQPILDSAKQQYQELDAEARSLISEVNDSGVLRVQVTNMNEAIDLLSKSQSPKAAALLSKLQESKAKQDALAPQLAGIEQLNTVSQNYHSMQASMTKALNDLRALPDSPTKASQIRMLETVQSELTKTGQLSPESARAYADFKVGRQVRTMEAGFNSDPDQTSQGRLQIRTAVDAFVNAGTPQEKDAAFSQIVTGLTNGTIFTPRKLENQNKVLTSLGLEPATTLLSPQQFLARIQSYRPSAVIEATVNQFGIMATGNDIARSNLTGEPPLSSIADRKTQYSSTAMNLNMSPSGSSALAGSNPVIASLLDFNQAADAERDYNYSLPPDQQAAAWGNTFDNLAASNAIWDQMENEFAASLKQLSQANDQVMVANGLPPLSSGDQVISRDPHLSASTQKLVDEADALADRLILAPLPAVNGEAFLSDLLNHFIDTIRDLDMKTRQLVLNQMAQKMVNNAITQFYKDKSDANNKHHQEALQRLQESFKAQITQAIESSMAGQATNNSQSVASMSGRVSGATLSSAMDNVPAQKVVQEMFNSTNQMSPPISVLQKQRILDGMARIMKAGGTPQTDDDQIALRSLNSILTQNRLNQ